MSATCQQRVTRPGDKVCDMSATCQQRAIRPGDKAMFLHPRISLRGIGDSLSNNEYSKGRLHRLCDTLCCTTTTQII